MRRRLLYGCLSLALVITFTAATLSFAAEDVARFRARDLGVETGIYLPGTYNAITDVPGVLVGQKTVITNPADISHRARSGVTAITPWVDNVFTKKAPAAIFLANAFGKLAGYTQVKELGEIETPILLTGTLNVPKVADALMTYMLGLPGMQSVQSINPVVGETNDGGLSDLRSRPVGEQDVFDALADLKTGPVLEGSVGAGTGTRALGWKAGIGTASRVLPPNRGGYTVGVLVQANFSAGFMTVNGAPVGRELGTFSFGSDIPYEPGSCMVIVATNAPIDARNLERLAKRAMYGLIKTGSFSSNGSGDYIIAFSTAYSTSSTEPVALLPNGSMDRLFDAALEAAEEAVLNSLFKATTVVGKNNVTSRAVPLEDVIRICEKYDTLFFYSKIAPWAPTTKVETVEDNAKRLEQLVGYVSSADINSGIKTSLLAKLSQAIAANSEALSFIQLGREAQANHALNECSNIIQAFKNEVEAQTNGQIPQPYPAMFTSRANLGIYICDKAIALPL
jgi:D-aminopeptidase